MGVIRLTSDVIFDSKTLGLIRLVIGQVNKRTLNANTDRVRKLISQRMLHPDAGLILNTQSESCFRHLFFEACKSLLNSNSVVGEETEINHQIENSFYVAPNHFATTAN